MHVQGVAMKHGISIHHDVKQQVAENVHPPDGQKHMVQQSIFHAIHANDQRTVQCHLSNKKDDGRRDARPVDKGAKILGSPLVGISVKDGPDKWEPDNHEGDGHHEHQQIRPPIGLTISKKLFHSCFELVCPTRSIKNAPTLLKRSFLGPKRIIRDNRQRVWDENPDGGTAIEVASQAQVHSFWKQGRGSPDC